MFSIFSLGTQNGASTFPCERSVLVGLWCPAVFLTKRWRGLRPALLRSFSALGSLENIEAIKRERLSHRPSHVSCDTYHMPTMSVSCFLHGSMGYKCYLSTRNQTLSSLHAAEDKDTPTVAAFHLLCSVGKHLTNFATIFFWAGFTLYNNPVMYGIQVGLATPTLLFLLSSGWPWHRSANRK